jgi:tape measure domain-containing protein
MATSSNRDVRLGVEIQTAGEENLQRLATEVRSLAKAGGDAAPKFLALADEIERTAETAKALSAFKQAAEGLDQTATAAREAAVEAERLSTAFKDQNAATDAARTAQRTLQQSLDATKRSIADQTLQQTLLKQSFKDGKVSADDYAASSTKMATALANLKKEQADQRIDLAAAKRVTSEASTELEKLRTASLEASKTSQTLGTALRTQTAAMDAAREAGSKLGADFTDVAIAQERLEAAMRGGVGVLEANAAAAREKAESDRLLAIEARGAAEAMERARVAAQSELLAIQESEKFTKQFATQQAALAAAVTNLTDDLDRQASVVRGKLITSMSEAAAAYEKEQAAIAETLAVAQRLAAVRLEQADADQLATAELRGLTAERERAALVAQSELAAIKESTEFGKQFERQQRETAAAVQALTDDLDRQAALVQGRLVKSLADAAAGYDRAEKEAEQAAVAVNRVNGYFEKLAAQRDVLKNAFGTTGVRSIQAIEQEMFKVSQALVTLRTDFASGGISLKDFERATASAQVRLAALKTEIATIPGDKSQFDRLAEGANNLIGKFGGVAAAAATVALAVKPVIDAFVALESTTRILTQVTGSSAEAAKQIEFLRKTAMQSGQSFTETSQSYAKFAASALQAGLSTEKVQAAFKAVALASGNLGLSTDQAKRALEALSQMASKGTVSMEELRQQLGDSLPGILPALAKQLNLTGKELNDLVESGGLLASEAIPAITAALGKLGPSSGGPVEGLVASFNRFKNVVTEAGTILLEGPLGKGVGALLTGLAGAFRDLTVVAVSASEAMNVVGKTIGLVAAALTGGIKGAKEFRDEFDKIALESAEKITRFKDRAYEGAEGVDALTEAVLGLTPATRVLSDSQQAAGTAAQAAGDKHAAAAAAVTQVGQAAGNASTLLFKLAVDYRANANAAKQAAIVAETLVEARRSEGETLKSIAALTGDETRQREAEAQAATLVATALRDVADKRTLELNVLTAGREAIVAQAAAEGTLDTVRKNTLPALDEQIAKLAAQVDKAKQAANASETQALAANVAAEALKNNTSKYEEFRRAVVQAEAAVDAVRRSMDKGYATSSDLEAATKRLASAQNLLRDSINDTVKASERYNATKAAESNVTTANLRLKLEEQKTLLRQAELHGNEAQALQAKIKIKQLEGEIAAEVAKQKIAEADETIRATEQARKELELLGPLTDEKRAELELRIKTAQAKRIEAQTSQEAAKGIADEIKQLQGLLPLKRAVANAAPAPGGPSPSPSPGGSPAPGAPNVLTNGPGGMSGLSGGPLFTTDANGRTARQAEFMAGQGGPVDASYVFQLRDRLNRGEGFSASELPAIDNALRIAKENQRLAQNSSVPDLSAKRDADMWVNVLTRVRAVTSSGDGMAPVGGTGGLGFGNNKTPSATPTPTAAATSGGTRTVNINLGGLGSTSINVASDADAAKVEALLRQIEQAMGRAGG